MTSSPVSPSDSERSQSEQSNQEKESELEQEATASITADDSSQIGSQVKPDKSCPDIESNKSDNISPELKELNPIYLPKEYEMLPEQFDPTEFPESYKQNTVKEARLLDYCENFRRQYTNLCPDRTRLLLIPENECGSEKFVCTTLNPTQLSYPELYTWDGAASLVADFLEFVPLVPSTELPKRLLSPATTVKIQKGTCFEYATLLCSLLLGVGYDAYVVSGYATRECCYMDQTRLISPYVKCEEKRVSSEEETDSKKYLIRPPRDLTSQFEQACLAKELQAEAERARLEKEQAELEEEEACKPPRDPLYGLRVHAWVLVLAGKREVPEAFFIEPLTGIAHPLDTPLYLGIESVWNANNYWVNMQDCSTGIAHMDYNLDNGLHWEYLLPSGSIRAKSGTVDLEFGRSQLTDTSDWAREALQVQSTLNFELISHDSTQSSHIVMPTTISTQHHPALQNPSGTGYQVSDYGDALKTKGTARKQVASLEDKLLLMDLPPSWTLPIRIDQEAYEFRYPKGHKTTLYRRCKVEVFAPFSAPDGVVFRLTNYIDREWKHPIDVLEKFKQRADKLIQRYTVIKTSRTTETFDHGRHTSHLAEHCFVRQQHGPQAYRSMTFYFNARIDGLKKREQTPTTMKEHFVGRADHLYYREVLFGAKVTKFGPAQMAKESDGSALVCVTTSSQLAIDKITERFSRDPTVEADDDVAERIFHIVEDRILLTYHIGQDRIAPCTREFIKPPPSDDRRNTIQLHSDTHTSFQVSLFAKPKTQVEIYNMLLYLLEQEEVSKQAVRKSEAEVRMILTERAQEELHVNLEVDLFDTLRNHEAHQLRLDLERAAEEERTRCKEVELDYLAPFLAQIEVTGGKLTREQAFGLREECLQDFKQRLITKANIIQARFERETDNLQKKQQWYQLNQINLTKDDEQEYLQFCNNATFRITTLETMLAKHKETAPQRYMDLEKKLRSDPRLSEFLQVA
ncbi:uncharacterized protein DEA37_0012095 [Paragonimus westermani]|uniref:Dynein regulatory complex subunit 7 n=1 Tax=Paragonimus westermani TaxID=34504 RepID=A0A5J4NV42_9TREM|nr:uncharacterized protein DEA37_0012095 [Paragonimus westermani]